MFELTRKKYQSIEKDFLEIDVLLNTKKKEQKAEISFKNTLEPIFGVIHFNTFIQLNLHRFIDLIENSSLQYESGYIPSSIFLSRASMEMAAVFWDVIKQINDFTIDNNFEKIEELLHNRVFGTRNSNDGSKSQNVLTAIKKVDKNYPKFLEVYEHLSNYCHPNFNSLVELYAKLNIENHLFQFD